MPRRRTLSQQADDLLSLAAILPHDPKSALSVEELSKKVARPVPVVRETLRSMGDVVGKKAGRYYRITNRS